MGGQICRLGKVRLLNRQRTLPQQAWFRKVQIYCPIRMFRLLLHLRLDRYWPICPWQLDVGHFRDQFRDSAAANNDSGAKSLESHEADLMARAKSNIHGFSALLQVGLRALLCCEMHRTWNCNFNLTFIVSDLALLRLCGPPRGSRSPILSRYAGVRLGFP